MAAPIAAYQRIDSSEPELFSSGLDGAEHMGTFHPEPPVVLSTLDDFLSRLTPEIHWKTVMLFPGDSPGETPLEAAAARAQPEETGPIVRLPTELPETPAGIMSASGFGLTAVILWRRRTHT